MPKAIAITKVHNWEATPPYDVQPDEEFEMSAEPLKSLFDIGAAKPVQEKAAAKTAKAEPAKTEQVQA